MPEQWLDLNSAPSQSYDAVACDQLASWNVIHEMTEYILSICSEWLPYKCRPSIDGITVCINSDAAAGWIPQLWLDRAV